jgi:NAD(P)-dependent dehydrogenase (short-subunit alcohol dehydrogenase family)
MPQLRFDDRVVVITGGGRGLGREYARLLASRGARIVVNDAGVSVAGSGFDAGPAEEVVREIEALGGEAIASTASVATQEGCDEIIETALDRFGQIDVLIANAGNVRRSPLAEMRTEDFQSVIDVHFTSSFRLVRAVMPMMTAANYGRIVLTSSIVGLYGNHQAVNYAMAKSGMIGLNNVAALEGEPHNVKSNIILPGSVTRIAAGADQRGFPAAPESLPETMAPSMIAPAVGWLAHETCSISGEMLISIGGRVARAFIAESGGVVRPERTIEDIAVNIEAIRDVRNPWVFPPVPSGQSDHIARSLGLEV